MTVSTDAAFMQNLDDWVMDDKQVVTYRFLGNELGVSSDVSKRMLQAYVNARGDKVQSMCIVSGKQQQNQLSVLLVDSASISKAKKSLASVTSVQIYSVQLAQSSMPLQVTTLNTSQANSVDVNSSSAESIAPNVSGNENDASVVSAEEKRRQEVLLEKQDIIWRSEQSQRAKLFTDSGDSGDAFRNNRLSCITSSISCLASAPLRVHGGKKTGMSSSGKSGQKATFDPYASLARNQAKAKAKKQKSKNSFFNPRNNNSSTKATSKTTTENKEKTKDENTASKTKTKKKNRGGIASFFGNAGINKSSSINTKMSISTKTSVEISKDKKTTKSIETAPKPKMDKRKSPPTLDKATKKNKKKRRLRRKVQSDSDEEVDEVQRLRMKQDEEDDIDPAVGEFDMRSEAELEAARAIKRKEREAEEAAEAARVLAAAQADERNGPKGKLKKKLIKKTYKDEEGFMVTEDVWVDASGDEGKDCDTVGSANKVNAGASMLFAKSAKRNTDNDEPIIIRETQPSPKKKKSSKRKSSVVSEGDSKKVTKKKKTKQKGMMSFFKRA